MTQRPGLSSPAKPLWPSYTKADLYDYYEAAADRLLPALAGRPVTFHRHPSGIGKNGFVQKDLPDHAPDSVGRFPDWSESSQRTVTYALVESVDALRWCAQQAAVELHAWLSRIDMPERLDTMVLDLDPGGRDVPVWQAAWWVREILDEIGLTGMVKTSGKSGLHVLVPIERRYGFQTVRAIALAVARLTTARHEDALTVEMRKDARDGRLLIDWSRHGRAQTIVTAWSPRATDDGTVATPLSWDEVDADLDPARFTIATVLDRPDVWADAPVPQRLERAARTLAEAGCPPVDVSPRGQRPTADRVAEALARATSDDDASPDTP